MKNHTPSGIVLSLLLACCVDTSALAGGHETGNGADSIYNHGNTAWFIDKTGSPRKISICLDREAAFPITSVQAQEAVEFAFQVWGTYASEREIVLQTDDGTFSPVSRFKWEQCSQRTDLKIVLGKTNDQILQDRKNFVDPIGYAWSSTDSSTNGWGKGYVWIADHPIFLQPGAAAFQQLILHEIGHVFGCDHIAGTLMRADVKDFILQDPTGEDYMKRRSLAAYRHLGVAGEIELDRSLIFPRRCYSHDPDGSCVTQVSASSIPSDKLRPFFSPLLEKVTGVYVTTETFRKKDSSEYLRIKWLFFRGFNTTPVEKSFEIQMIGTAIETEDHPYAFNMKLGQYSFSLDASATAVLTANVSTSNESFEGLVVKDTAFEGANHVWIIHQGKRIPLN